MGMVDYPFLSHLRDVGERVHQLIIPDAEPVVVAILGFWDDAPRLVGVAAGHGDAREYALYPELRPDGLRPLRLRRRSSRFFDLRS